MLAKFQQVIYQAAINQEPDTEHSKLEIGFRNIERVNKFPREVKGKNEQRHAVSTRTIGLSKHEKVADGPEHTTYLKEASADCDDVGWHVRRGNVVRTHIGSRKRIFEEKYGREKGLRLGFCY